MKTFLKELPWRSPKYLNYIRSLDCCECGLPAHVGKIEAHHIETGGMATKCGDDFTVPLCAYPPSGRGCHWKADKAPETADKYRPLAQELAESWKIGLSK